MSPRRLVWLAFAGAFAFISLSATAARVDDGFTVSHVTVADLGHERIRHAVLRHGRQGERLVGWRSRIVELPLKVGSQPVEVVAAKAGLEYSNGGCAMDLDGDGIEEIVVARAGPRGRDIEFVWFEESPKQTTWTAHHLGHFESETSGVPHDISPVRFSSPKKETIGIAAVIARQTLVWFERPADPRKPWTRHAIATLPKKNQSGLEVGDVNGDGRPDLLCGMFWVECPPDPTAAEWTPHRFGDWDKNGWGGMTKHALADLDGDGTPEIVASEAEIPNARLGIFRAPADRTGPWSVELLDERLYCPHSLVVGDLHGDGRTDIIAGEMTAGGWSFPLHDSPRVLAWLNRGGNRFEQKVLTKGVGIHEMGLIECRQPRGLLLYGADEIQDQKFPKMNTLVSYWLITPKAAKP